MLALIPAGGRGTRLNMGEKSLVKVNGSTMLSYVLAAFEAAGIPQIVVLSSHTPYTINWCRVQGIEFYISRGEGYVEDIVECIKEMDLDKALFTSASDLPCLSPDIVLDVRKEYLLSGKEACSVWVPKKVCEEVTPYAAYTAHIDGIEACPAGLNILRGDLVDEIQDELSYLISDVRLAFNVNTPEDLKKAESFLRC